jgi:putative addiction module component (TIGR02574 family)
MVIRRENMTLQTKEILKKALLLPPVERAELIDQVFRSFDCDDKNDFDALWAEEAEARIDAFEKSKLKAIPAKEVFRKIK